MGIRSPKPAFGIEARIFSNGSRLKKASVLKSIFTSVRIPHENAYYSDFKRAILYPRPTLSQGKTGISLGWPCSNPLSAAVKGKNIGFNRFYHGLYCRGYHFTLWLTYNKWLVAQAPLPDGGIGILVAIGTG